MGSAVVVSIPEEIQDQRVTDDVPVDQNKNKNKTAAMNKFRNLFDSTRNRIKKQDMKKIFHSIKLGIALVVVSLLYLLNPLYKQVGDNAMWAIMTVIVVFEFYAGATLSKGLNRGLGTIFGGGLGCFAGSFAQDVGGDACASIIGVSVLVFGGIATYLRLIPSIKKKYDYGVMISILTFNLVVVSGMREEKIMALARERLSTIGMGFAVCIFINLLIFPAWASDELHHSTVQSFHNLANSIEGCMEDYFSSADDKKKNKSDASFSSCKATLNTKSKEESLANFAKWEPWHGKFGLNYPWNRYLQIGEVLRELAATVLSIKGCLQSPRQPTSGMREAIKEACEMGGSSIAWALKELGEGIKNMKRCQIEGVIVPKLKLVRQEMSGLITPSKLGVIENGDGLAMASFVFLIMEILEKVEELAREVEELEEAGRFRTT
ncbi:aluminum-activated malate transporter 12-like [Cucurbita moschata]|uniref:Aluminum-activated malate transporter 12-like n=1 Tax=Cucurbita moschata TaxID=3662 RepID=A0A6J1HKY4_CUCMO|nr:aluminum-activated malate transporter 12-like [Cucurbita moschata]